MTVKLDTYNLLIGALNTYILGLTYMKLVTSEQLRSLEKSRHDFLDQDGEFSLNVEFLSDLEGRKDYESSFERQLKRSALRESFEPLKACVISYETKGNFLRCELLDYCRVLRNTVSHGKFDVIAKWPDYLRKKRISEVSWRHRVLTEGDVGKTVSMTTSEVSRLLLDMLDFINLIPEES
jgi:hypothetical protein